ncbi:acylphosphatase [Frankia casuarinae]|nr:acylphosphatase [Frankia sp. CcI6]EYT93495.1 acylphosphatase [Frankia casuarinae]KDA43742.1 acylphosphatase [Frankia sp. BMG5.23]KEZ36169.1 acylphosphatase [Frankia sp. CeD]KFB05189.1 acylphosphatase [Frankia sp. Allo2]
MITLPPCLFRPACHVWEVCGIHNGQYPTVLMSDVSAEQRESGHAVVRFTARVAGLVQGVGFRDYVRTRGRRLGLVGSATNLPDGAVEVVAEGPEPACRDLLHLLMTGHTPGRTDRVEAVWQVAQSDLTDFRRK